MGLRWNAALLQPQLVDSVDTAIVMVMARLLAPTVALEEGKNYINNLCKWYLMFITSPFSVMVELMKLLHLLPHFLKLTPLHLSLILRKDFKIISSYYKTWLTFCFQFLLAVPALLLPTLLPTVTTISSLPRPNLLPSTRLPSPKINFTMPITQFRYRKNWYYRILGYSGWADFLILSPSTGSAICWQLCSCFNSR